MGLIAFARDFASDQDPRGASGPFDGDRVPGDALDSHHREPRGLPVDDGREHPLVDAGRRSRPHVCCGVCLDLSHLVDGEPDRRLLRPAPEDDHPPLRAGGSLAAKVGAEVDDDRRLSPEAGDADDRRSSVGYPRHRLRHDNAVDPAGLDSIPLVADPDRQEADPVDRLRAVTIPFSVVGVGAHASPHPSRTASIASESATQVKTLRPKLPVGINYLSGRRIVQMVALSIWYGAGATLLLVGAVIFVVFAVVRGDLGSPYYSLPPLQALLGAVLYAVLALAMLGEVTRLSPAVLRYVGVFVTFPIAVYYLGILAGASAVRRVTAVSLVMIAVAAAYVTTVTAANRRLGLAGLSVAAVLALVWSLVRRFDSSETESTLFYSLRDLTVAALLAYPVAYLLGPMWLGVLVAGDFGIVHLAVNAVFSLGFLVLVVSRSYEIKAATAGGPAPG